MVPRYLCRYDSGMFEEVGGQYVDAGAYDKLLILLGDISGDLDVVPLRRYRDLRDLKRRIDTVLSEVG